MGSFSLPVLQLRDKAELFPVLTLCNCISDAEESSNGARYSAQDKFTGCVYEVRCLPLKVSGSKKEVERALGMQQQRLDALVAASQRRNMLPSVLLPIDAYVQELAESKEYFVISVSSFAGLSLGDMIRSGYRLLEDADFKEILSCVEEYALESVRLPPHRNLTLNAILRQLALRPGTVEMSHSSRWAIGDWLLFAENTASITHEELVRDLEWLLYSAFSKLNVSCEGNGDVLRKDIVEMRISETIERIKRGPMNGVRRDLIATFGDAHVKRQSDRRRSLVEGYAVPAAPVDGGDGANELVDKVALHRQKLHQEQHILQSFRREKGKEGGSRVVLRHNEVEPDEVEVPRRRVKFMETLYPSKILRSVTLETEESKRQFVGRKQAIVDVVTETLDICVQRDARNRKMEEEARHMRRDAILSMLMRSATISSKRAKYPSVDTGSAPHGTPPSLHGTPRFKHYSPSATKGPIPRGDDSMYDPATVMHPSPSPRARRPDLQRRAVLPVLPSKRGESERISTPQRDLNGMNEDHLLSSTSSRRKEAVLPIAKAIAGISTNENITGRTNKRMSSSRRSSVNSTNLTERPTFTGGSPLVKPPQSTRRRQLSEMGNRRNVRSAPRRLAGNYSTPHVAVGNRAASATNVIRAPVTSHYPSETPSVSEPNWRSESDYRLPRRRSKIAADSGAVLRGHVRPVNETSLGITMRRRYAAPGEGIV
ncbi:hypothetical protein TCDM_06367 [Trypanosoma cruzi Dm28c]|uniref:Uncharacterized protein n=2 Tax=Trypanosoma cruzi TaxID=5693 RepID=V5BLD3_TRYCR|nr:hypothetical protein TCDM_06367 [Trypanosoma cruzi Dm28c]PBJ80855.1 hypothetical protein BCY84_01060 [Trypanosoma cruzi cruzi]PWU96637.1 hypothetical protein C4B63_18g296 [Trypanosoma cruzi]